MELLLQQVTAGLATGAIYAAMALAIVMIYQAIDHLNFAQGEMAMFSTFLAWQMLQWGWPYWAAFVAAIALSFVGGVAIERVLFKPIQNAPILSQLAAFIALFGILNSGAGWIWDFNSSPSRRPFGSAPLFGERLISTHQAGMIGVTLLMLALLYLFLSRPRLGLAMRAAATNPESARLVGIRVGWMIALGWGMSAAIGAVAGMLIAPVVFLEPNMMLGVLLYGFAGAVLGGLSSPGGAVARRVCGRRDREPRRDLYPLCRARAEIDDRPPPDRRGADGQAERRLRPRACEPGMTMPDRGRRWRSTRAAVSITRPSTRHDPDRGGGDPGFDRCRFSLRASLLFQLTLVMVYGLAILGLNLLTGFNGQFSLGHSAFYGIGAYTAAILMDKADLAYFWTLPCAGAVCFVVGFLFGLPALRLQGLYLALATFALATAMPQILKFSALEPLTGGVQGIVILKPDPPPGCRSTPTSGSITSPWRCCWRCSPPPPIW